LTVFKNIKKAIVAVLAGTMVISSAWVLPVGAENVNSPYDLIDGGCVKTVNMHSSQEMHGGLTYYTAEVTSHIQGELTRAEIPYEVYGAIGNSDTKMFVYSIGNNTDQDYKTHKVIDIVERFERDNPAWDVVVAINGDFFDIEKSLTSSIGEPEGPMIQLGAIMKGYLDNVPGRGVVGVKSDGTVIYKTIGAGYDQNGYGTNFSVSRTYLDITFSDKDTGATLYEYSTCYGGTFDQNSLYLSTVNTGNNDLSGRTVCVIKCDTYRHSHVPANGVEGGTLGNYVFGEVVDIRKGTANEQAESGYVLLSFPENISANKIKIGMKVECEPQLEGEWRDVINAVGYKQQILAEGNVLLKNCYGTYNKKGDYEETLRWTADIYDYPHCWKNRTALGFKADGTPVLLVAARSSHKGAHKNLGASYYELGEQLKTLGCVNGFLLDGGGSSTFVVRNPDGTFSNAFVGEGTGRAVGNAVILAVRDESVPLPEEEEKPTVPLESQATTGPNTETTTTPPEKNPDETTGVQTTVGSNTDITTTPPEKNSDETTEVKTPVGSGTDITMMPPATNGNTKNKSNFIIIIFVVVAVAAVVAASAAVVQIKRKK
jgi:hypothetical protein